MQLVVSVCTETKFEELLKILQDFCSFYWKEENRTEILSWSSVGINEYLNFHSIYICSILPWFILIHLMRWILL